MKGTPPAGPTGDFIAPQTVVNNLDQSFSGWEPKKLFHWTPGGGRYEECAYAEGFESRADGRSLVAADLDGDGDLDLVLWNRAAPRLQLFENVGQGGNAMAVELRATKGHREADGAVVLVDGVGAVPVVLARGYASAVDPAVHVGLGERTEAQVRVRWRSGAEERFGSLKAGARHLLVEGTGQATRSTPFRARREVTPSPWPATTAALPLATPPKGPLVVQLFMQSCKPCREEVPGLNALAARGVRVLGLGVHPAAELPKVKAELGMKYEVKPIPDAVAEAFEGAGGLALPTTLLYDAQGRLARVVPGPAQLPAALREVGVTNEARP